MNAAIERPSQKAALRAMVDAGDKVEEAMRAAWPLWWKDYQEGGTHPLQIVANVLHRQFALVIYATTGGEMPAEQVLAAARLYLHTTDAATTEMAEEGEYLFPQLAERTQ